MANQPAGSMCVPGAEPRLPDAAQGLKLTQTLSYVRPPDCLRIVHRLTAPGRRLQHAIGSELAPARCASSPSWVFQAVVGPDRTQLRHCACAFATIIVGQRDCWSVRKASVKACYVSTAFVASAVYSLRSSAPACRRSQPLWCLRPWARGAGGPCHGFWRRPTR